MPNLTERQLELLHEALAFFAWAKPQHELAIAEIQLVLLATANSGLEPALLLLEESP